ncbi:hypothetical protein PsYK624_061130 [Phanerochaete sordida]|uniref:Uncharacterized protein n=1 Tax=Phanerochaete sordida TaxID=48140 RepID=A0A9P3LCW6_9APHY|nr:hypothetical protein PsYK624_061130 [Phanerochaete sordida]
MSSSTNTVPDAPQSAPASGQTLTVEWTAPAKAEAVHMKDEPRFRGDVEGWHETKVRAYARTKLPIATRARIRKCAHRGINGTEPEHITVSFKQLSRDLGAYLVYTE